MLRYVLTTVFALSFFSNPSFANCPDMLDHEFDRLHSSETVNLCSAADAKAILFVNTASHCGFTGQFEGLEALHQKFGSEGLSIIGFPSNDFRQEASDEAQTAKICYVNYGVTFDMTAPISVKGEDAHPLFKSLAESTKEPSWNFNKYLYNPVDQSVTHYGSRTKPQSDELVTAIEQIL